MKRKLVVFLAAALSAAVSALAEQGVNPQSENAPAAEAPTVKIAVPEKAAKADKLSWDNFISKWNILGPFFYKEADMGGSLAAALDKEFVNDEANLKFSAEAPKGTSWRLVDSKTADMQVGLDMAQLLGKSDGGAAAYAVATVEVAEDQPDVKMYLDKDDGDDFTKVWLNGQLVLDSRKMDADKRPENDYSVKVGLKKGVNRIVLKSVDVGGGWDFFLRFTDAAGRPFSTTK